MKHIPALDGLRAVAALIVVCHHANVPGFDSGYLGVDVFFVLSGYLITSILDGEARSGGIRFGAFYLRRARRLYPALLLMVGLVMAFAPVFETAPTWRDALASLLYLSDYGAADFGVPSDALKITWSLSVEEHFYLLWPLAVVALARLPKLRAAQVLVAVYFLLTLWRGWAEHHWDWRIAYYRFDSHCAGLVLGAALAYLPALQRRWWLITALLLGVAWQFQSDFVRNLAMTPTELATAAVILWAVNGRVALLELASLRFLGRISYGIYLFHWPIVYYFHALPWPELLTVTVAGSVGLATLSYFTVERAFRVQRRDTDSPKLKGYA